MTDEPVGHLRPFFPSARDFAAATTPHFGFLVTEFGFAGPVVTENFESFDVRYDGRRTSLLLNWDADGGYIGIHLIPRRGPGAPDPDAERWLRPNEILAARGAVKDAVTHADFEGVDQRGFAVVMEREAANLRKHCADVLRGDWSIYSEAHGWFERHLEAV